MRPIKFKGSNCVFAEHQPEYLPLPAYKAKDKRGSVVSCWKLTLRERFKILLRGKVYFTVSTFNEPLQPQRSSVESPLRYKS